MPSFQPNDPKPGDPVTYSGWPKGMDTRTSDFNLPAEALRDAVNVDILTSGRPRMRAGPRQIIADPDAHSVFSDESRIVWATQSALKLCADPAALTPVVSTLLTDLRLGSTLSMLALHGEIYFSNELINGKINSENAHEQWGIAPPIAAPVLSATSGNRIVQVTCAFVTSSGYESGCPLAVAVACGDSPVIQVSNIPQSTDSRVVATRLYATEPDGKALYSVADVPRGTTSTTISGHFDRGEIRKNIQKELPPPGQLLEYSNGVIWIAVGNLLYHAIPWDYAACDPEKSFFILPERVTLLKAVADGLFVSSNQTFFLPAAGTDQVQLQLKAPYKAIEGAAASLPNSEDVIWLSERGRVRGTAGGQIENVTEAQIAMPKYRRACLGFTERDGHKVAVAISRDAGTASPLLSKDWTALHVVPSFSAALTAPAPRLSAGSPLFSIALTAPAPVLAATG